MVHVWLFCIPLNGVKRRFVLLPTAYSYPRLPYLNRHQFEEFDWLAYSRSKGGAFCRYCVAFVTSDSQVGSSQCGQTPGVLVAKPLTDFSWMGGKGGIMTRHEQTDFHQSAMAAAANVAQAFRLPKTDIRSRIDRQRERDVAANRLGCLSIIRVVRFCGLNGLPLRGHRDDGRVDPGDTTVQDGVFRGKFGFVLKLTRSSRISCAPLHRTFSVPVRLRKMRFWT